MDRSVNLGKFKSPNDSPHIFTSDKNSIAIYTVICILQRMRSQLGLEAMLEYAEKYLETIEKNNPELKSAVAKALCLMSVERIYRNAVGRE